VPARDDHQFEHYLKQFRPLAPEPVPIVNRHRATRRTLVFAACAMAGAIILTVSVLIAQLRPKPLQQQGRPATLAGVEQLRNPQPLTISSANALLAQASSIKAALDQVAFHSQSIPLPKGKQSALAVLSQDNNKL
jgi:hypothetical protein